MLMDVSFKSNPPLPDRPRIVPLEKDGVVINQVIYERNDNHSELESINFSAETMSLRAKLNLGVDLRQVHIGQLENDPTELQKLSVAFESSVLSRLSDLDSNIESDPNNVES